MPSGRRRSGRGTGNRLQTDFSIPLLLRRRALRFVLPNDRMRAGVFVHPAGHAGGPESDNPDAPTFADDPRSTAEWATLVVEASSFADIGPASFEVVDLGPEIDLTYDCVRNP